MQDEALLNAGVHKMKMQQALLGLGQDAMKREKAFKGPVSEDPKKTAS